MTSLTLLDHNLTIFDQEIRIIDGLYSLNDLHRASGGAEEHQPAFFMRNAETKELIDEIKQSANLQSDNIFKKINGGTNRGTFVCKELVYRYAIWISPKFALLVIRVFDEYVTGNQQPRLTDLSTVESRIPLKDAINMLVPRIGLSYSDCYRMIHQRFSINSVDELTNEQVSQAVEYVHTVLVGEYIPAEVPEVREWETEEYKRTHRVAAVALMTRGFDVFNRQAKELREFKRMIDDIYTEVDKLIQKNGAVYDGLHEAQCHLCFKPDIMREGHELGRK